LGFHCSEYTAANDHPKSGIDVTPKNPEAGWQAIATDDIWAAWLHRKPNVHDIAMMNGKGPRLHHVGFWAYDRVKILDACDVLASMGYADAIERGPGRHGLSNAFFLYLRDPSGNRIEIYSGDYLITDWDMPPVRWSINDKRRATFWGHIPPKSWFEEASLVEDVLTGELLPTTDATMFHKPDFVV
jgi:catechol 2,3-dioxygenase-like lactoylglutathione lyase family enzyme